MRKLSLLIAGAVTVLALLAIGCGGSDEPSVSVTQGGGSQSIGGALVPLNRFLEFNGQRYMLTLELFEDMVDESEFQPIGEATSVDIPLPGGNTVYARTGDPDAVFTLTPATADDGKIWLRWARISTPRG